MARRYQPGCQRQRLDHVHRDHGVDGNYYFKRAVVALIGLGSNPSEDAVYPLQTADADGNATTGENDYTIHFDADKLPPVSAFCR